MPHSEERGTTKVVTVDPVGSWLGESVWAYSTVGCGSGRWMCRSEGHLESLIEVGLFAGPHPALRAASNPCGGRQPLTQAAKGLTRTAPWQWAGRALTMASFHPLRPALATKGSFILKQKPGEQTTQHPELHRPQRPWQSSLSRGFWALTLLQRATVGQEIGHRNGWRARSKSHISAIASMPSR